VSNLFTEFLQRERLIRSQKHGLEQNGQKIASNRAAEVKSAVGHFFKFVKMVFKEDKVDFRYLLE